MSRCKGPARRIITLTGLIMACGMCLLAESHSSGRQPDQVVFLIDDSSSMTEPGFDPDRPNTSRWELVQEAYPKWLSKLAPSALTGLVTVGGDCNASPGVSMPVQLDRSQLQTALRQLAPNGWTKLNAVLESSPALFNNKITGSRRIVLLSDGLNTCAPLKSTCEIARDLHAKYGITIDVVSMVTDPAVEQEFKCVTSETGGIFSAPGSYLHLTDLHFGDLDPWLYVILVLSFITLALAARIFYRQAIHVWRWTTGSAVSAGTLLLISGTLCAYIALFARTGWPSMLLGLILLLGMIVSSRVTRRRAEDDQVYRRRPSATLLCGGILVLLSAFSTSLSSGQALPASCGKVVHGNPQYHHIIALDLSGSVARHLPEMKLLIACYAVDFALPGEDVTLIAFGTDQRGSVKEIQTFTVPPNGSTEILNSLLDDIQVQAPRDTRTYYRPLADFINEFLKKVRLQPIILVVSDGLSDGYHDAATGQVNFREIPFESFGKHGIYSAPGMHGWRVAIDAGPSLDLSALFQHPIAKSGWLHRAAPLGSVLTPCLVDPQVYFEPDDRLVLTPVWNPIDSKATGTLHISVTSECVTRLRSFRVQARRGQEAIDLGLISSTPIGANPRIFSLPISQLVIHDEEELSIQLVLDQGKSNRMVYPQKNTVTKVITIPYWRTHGISAVLSALALLGIGLMLVVVLKKYSKARLNKPQFLKTVGGYAVAIYPSHQVSIGGSDCDIAIPEVPTRTILAFVQANGTVDTVLLHPQEGVQIKLNGHTTSGNTVYQLGHQIQFACANGRVYELTLFKAVQDDVGFGAAVFGTNNKNHLAIRDDENAVVQTSHSNGFPI